MESRLVFENLDPLLEMIMFCSYQVFDNQEVANVVVSRRLPAILLLVQKTY